jgi:hypothetical protein
MTIQINTTTQDGIFCASINAEGGGGATELWVGDGGGRRVNSPAKRGEGRAPNFWGDWD